MAPRFISLWYGKHAGASSAARKSHRRYLLLERLDERILLSSTLVEGSTDSLVFPPTASAQVAAANTPASGSDQAASLGSPTTISGSIVPTCYSPQQIEQAYGLNQIPLNGAGQTIAIVAAFADPDITNDLIQFDAYWRGLGYKLPDPPSLRVVGQSGGAPPPITDPTGNWELEQSADVELAHAIAPGANILLVEANTASSPDLFAAVNYARNQPGVSVVSMSWGQPQSAGESTYDGILTTPAGHTGITFVAGSGDSSYAAYPAASPKVLGVGGTILYLNSSGNYGSEDAWSGSGGGPSLTGELQPSYQKGVVPASMSTVYSIAGSSESVRTIPDVSYNAGSTVAVYDSFDTTGGPWIGFGGTSAGTPQWAALIALADQGRAQEGMASLDGASQTLPLLYHLPSSAFHDITLGSNAEYSAGPGYDLVTGLGSPVGNQVVAGLIQPFTIGNGGSSLYQLDNGSLWRYNSSGWSLIIGNVTQFALSPSGSNVYVISGGELDAYTYGVGWNWDIATNVTSFALSPSGSTFYDVSGGVLNAYTYGVGWNWDVATNVTSFALSPSGSTFYDVSGGELDAYTYGVGWNWDIATNVTSFALSPSGSTFYDVSGGVLNVYTYGVGWNWDVATNVTSFALSPSGSTFYDVSGGVLNAYTYGVGWNWDIASDVTSFALSLDGSTFYVVSGGELDSYTAGVGWQWDIASNVASFVLGPGGYPIVTASHASTSTAASSTSATFSPASQTILLSATITSAAGSVDDGTETFTILIGETLIGSAVTANVGNGTASASYVLPNATSTGTYTIQAVYNGAADFLGSTDTSHSLTISPDAACKVVFEQQPTNSIAGAAINPAVTVEVEDQYGNLVTTSGSTVTLALSIGALESGSRAVTAVASSGVATFSDLKIDLAGTYALSATDPILAPSTESDSFTITAAPATQLVVTTPPPNSIKAGQAFTVVVSAEDQFHNVVSTFNGDLTVALANNPDASTLGGAATVAVVDGEATFSDLTVADAKSGYILQISGNGLTSITTSPFDVALTSTPTSSPSISTPATGPTIIGKQVVTIQKKTKSSKSVSERLKEPRHSVYAKVHHLGRRIGN